MSSIRLAELRLWCLSRNATALWRCLRHHAAQMLFRVLMPLYELNEIQLTCLETNFIQSTSKQLVP